MYDAPTLIRLTPPDDDPTRTTAYLRGDPRAERPAGRYRFAVHYTSPAFETDAPLPTVPVRPGVLD
jgi:hypothetical protein